LKKIFILVILTIPLFKKTEAQTKDTVNIFAGLVGFEGVNTKNPKEISGFANLRVGAQYTKSLSKKTSINTWVSFDPESNLIIFKAMGKTFLAKDLYVQYGFGPTPGTLIRPFPLSVDGQFEFTSESMPPGGALGGFVSYKNTKLGIYTRNNNPEYHIGQNVGNLQTDFWFSKDQAGATAQLATKRVYLMATVTNENRQALATAIQPFKAISWKIVHDFGISKGKVTNNLVGLLYPMKIKNFNDARFGFAYDFTKKSVGVFWLLGLDR
jgi:hypothetical protein